MQKKLLYDISASAFQVIINQLAGLGVFLLTSFFLAKDDFGELSWAIAIMTFATTTLSLRLEQLVVRKAASAPDASGIMTLFLLHVFFTGIGFWLLLFLLSFLFPHFFSVHNLLLIIGISQLISFFSSPFRQVANGKERFGYLAVMSSVSNIVRFAGLLIVVLFFKLTPFLTALIFIAGSVTEFLISFLLVTKRMQIKLSAGISLRSYCRLLRESLPQIGTAILMAGITRMDWILLGFFSTAALTAEYSFAYRVFELSPFPLLIIAPVLLSRFSKLFAENNKQDVHMLKEKLAVLVRFEMILATIIPLVLNMIWVPLLEPLTKGKYGASNADVFLILSFCTPFQYITNILWTAGFAQNRLKLILKITAITFFIILTGDLLAIPYYTTTGAALVYLAAVIAEYINYMRWSPLPYIKETWLSLLICTAIAVASGFAAVHISENSLLQVTAALTVYLILAAATGQITKTDISYILSTIKKGRNLK